MTNKILIGADQTAPLYTFTDATIRTVSCVLSSAMSGDELAIDQLLPTVYSEAYIRVRFVPSGSSGLRTADGKRFMVYPDLCFLDKLPYGTPIWYYSGDTLMGKFYSKRVVRSGKTWFDITSVSAIGILDGQKHYGGIYTGQKFRDVAADIIGGAVSFSCSSSGQSKSYSVILPAGRMRGDVDGDGAFTVEDKNILNAVIMNEMTQDDFDAQSWSACDVNGDGEVGFIDYAKIRKLVESGSPPGGVGPEITGNWTNNPNYATDTAQFYADISVSGVTASDTASITVEGTFDKVERVECLDGAVRVYVSLCPIEDVPCTVTIHRTSGSGGSASENPDVGDIQIYGWLPVDTRRNNLHQLLLAYGVTVAKDTNGDMVFGFPDTTTVKDIPNGRIFLGGNVDYMTPATRVEITEHAFLRLPSDETVTLYDNTDGSGAADNTPIIFQDAPVYGLEVSGSLRIIESNVNHAVVSGTGILTGKKYTHTTKIIAKETGASGEQKTVSVTDAYLVNAANSDNVARRILSYYASAKTIAADIKVDGEKPGDQISFSDPFGEQETAFLASMDINASSFLRASCELVTGYIPAWQGNNYSNVIILTGSGTWVIPEEARKNGRAVLIGGGDGGGAGLNGEDSPGGFDSVGNPGKGGEAGKAGLGGKILSVEIDLSGMESIAYSCGAGGTRGLHGDTPTEASPGGETRLGSYSSASGERTTYGCVNLFTGEIYGLPGKDGVSGGNGSHNNETAEENKSTIEYNGVTYKAGENGKTVTIDSPIYCGGVGGGGGGPAAGNDGGPGGDGSGSKNSGKGFGTGGNGGAGADAVAPSNATVYGSGGPGGNGGGGGGQPGKGIHSSSDYRSAGDTGHGGAGSDGGDGAPGCIIVYY